MVYEDRNTGAMFPAQKRSDKSPDMFGHITITDELLDYIVRNARSGSVKISVSAWRKMSKGGKAFTSLAVSEPMEQRQQARPQQRQQQGYRQQRMDYGRDDRRTYPADRNHYHDPGTSQHSHRVNEDDFSRGDTMPDFNVDRRDDDDTPPWV